MELQNTVLPLVTHVVVAGSGQRMQHREWMDAWMNETMKWVSPNLEKQRFFVAFVLLSFLCVGLVRKAPTWKAMTRCLRFGENYVFLRKYQCFCICMSGQCVLLCCFYSKWCLACQDKSIGRRATALAGPIYTYTPKHMYTYIYIYTYSLRACIKSCRTLALKAVCACGRCTCYGRAPTHVEKPELVGVRHA